MRGMPSCRLCPLKAPHPWRARLPAPRQDVVKVAALREILAGPSHEAQRTLAVELSKALPRKTGDEGRVDALVRDPEAALTRLRRYRAWDENHEIRPYTPLELLEQAGYSELWVREYERAVVEGVRPRRALREAPDRRDQSPYSSTDGG